MGLQAQVFLCVLLSWKGVIEASSANCGAADVCESQNELASQEKVASALLQVGKGVHSAEPFLAEATKTDLQRSLSAVQEEKPEEKKLVTKTVAVKTVRSHASNVSVEDLALPPNQGPILWNMVRVEPWNCDFVPRGDPRENSCHLEADSDTLHPDKIRCSDASPELACSIENANAYRTLHEVGSLPCCSTPPFCAAPTCAELHGSSSKGKHTCTKRTGAENAGYMKSKDAWPAYHGWGGSFELDTLKFLDVLSCHGPADKCPETPFDLSLDFGANTGYYTEKLSVRNWAKHYLMIEANPLTSAVLDVRWGNQSWRNSWFTEQVHLKDGQEIPDTAIVTKPLSNHSDGQLDMCQTEGSMGLAPAGCVVNISTVDDIIPEALSLKFQGHFKEAQSAFIKIDTEGMDELVLRGMTKLFSETRGKYEDGSSKYLVNFLQFEYSPALMAAAKNREGFQEYDIKTVTEYLESIGFETFMIGPRYLPLSHGSYDDGFKTWTEDPNNNAGKRVNYPEFTDELCPYCSGMDTATFTSDIFAMRSSHPRASEIKVALGACEESSDFDVHDEQYSFDKILQKTDEVMEELSDEGKEEESKESENEIDEPEEEESE